MAILLQDGGTVLLQDGSRLLAQDDGGSVTLPAAAAVTAAAAALVPAVALAAAAAVTAAAAAFTPGVPLPAAPGATAAAYGPAASLPLPAAAAATAAALVPFPAAVVPAAQPAAAGYPLVPAVLLPAAAQVQAAGYGLELELPPAAAVTAAGGFLYPAAVIPAAAGAAAAGYVLRPPIPRAAATAAALPLYPAVLLPAARVRAAARVPLPPAGSALNPGYPDGDLDAKLELNLDGTWTDITQWTTSDGAVSGTVTSGQRNGAQQPSPATLAGTWDNGDYRFSPRNADGPWFGQLRKNTPARVSFASPYGTYLRLETDAASYVSCPDSAGVSITGDIDIRLAVSVSDWRASVLAAKWNSSSDKSWVLALNDDGTLHWEFWDGTADHAGASTAPVAPGFGCIRVTLDVNNGSGGHTSTFYTGPSLDGPWTQLGDAETGSGTLSLSDSTAPVVIGYSTGYIETDPHDLQGLTGKVYGFRLYSGIGGTLKAGPDFTVQVPGTAAFTDPQANTWTMAGTAEVTARDYRLHGELASIVPSADTSGSARTKATVSGRLRRLQLGTAPPADSALKRAIMSQAGSLSPVMYWPMEDGGKAVSFGPAIGSGLLTVTSGTVTAGVDSSLEASAPLPQLNGAVLHGDVPSYSGGTAWMVRFTMKRGLTLPASGTVRLLEVNTTGACTKLTVSVNPDGTVNFKGTLSGGSTAFSFTEIGYPQLPGPAWWSVEATTSGSGVQYNLVALAPGASSGNQEPQTVTGHGSFGVVTSFDINQDAALNDTVIGHVSVQKAWSSGFTLGDPLNAWRGEVAADRFARICAENSIGCRIYGPPALTQAMGPQPAGSIWTILRDAVNADQGLIFEPRDSLGLAFRTRGSMTGQGAAVTLSFDAANLPGALSAADDDRDLVNDVTAKMPDGTSLRVVLDDGSPASVSEPADGGAGRYAASPPLPFNLADASQLADAAAFYLAVHSVDEARYDQLGADFGIPAAPAADIARLQPGDLIVITGPPGAYQSDDIRQLATGATETFGPGRSITWDCVPASPYDA